MSPRELSWSDGTWSLTDRQREVLAVIERYIDRYDYAPSIRDIMQHSSLASTASVVYVLKALEGMGYIKRDRCVARSIRVCE